MQQPIKAALEVNWGTGPLAHYPVQFNPTEITFNKAAQMAEIPIPGLDAPILQFVRGQAETVTVDLFFDSTEDGTGAGATSVVERTDRIYQLVKIVPTLHAPPICRLVWGQPFPGSRVGMELGSHRRTFFPCVVESVRHKYTLFSPSGAALRATLTLTLKEYRTVEEQFAELNLNSPDRTQVHVLKRGDTLSSVAAAHYLNPAEWRRVADANVIEDPRRLTPGAFVRLPPVR